MKRPSELTQTKTCQRCGRVFQNRKKWAGRDMWEQVRYCSKRCRNNHIV